MHDILKQLTVIKDGVFLRLIFETEEYVDELMLLYGNFRSFFGLWAFI